MPLFLSLSVNPFCCFCNFVPNHPTMYCLVHTLRSLTGAASTKALEASEPSPFRSISLGSPPADPGSPPGPVSDAADRGGPAQRQASAASLVPLYRWASTGNVTMGSRPPLEKELSSTIAKSSTLSLGLPPAAMLSPAPAAVAELVSQSLPFNVGNSRDCYGGGGEEAVTWRRIVPPGMQFADLYNDQFARELCLSAAPAPASISTLDFVGPASQVCFLSSVSSQPPQLSPNSQPTPSPDSVCDTNEVRSVGNDLHINHDSLEQPVRGSQMPPLQQLVLADQGTGAVATNRGNRTAESGQYGARIHLLLSGVRSSELVPNGACSDGDESLRGLVLSSRNNCNAIWIEPDPIDGHSTTSALNPAIERELSLGSVGLGFTEIARYNSGHAASQRSGESAAVAVAAAGTPTFLVSCHVNLPLPLLHPGGWGWSKGGDTGARDSDGS